MKVSWQWLQNYVEVSLRPAEVAEQLTYAGLEVESLSEWKPSFQRVVVAQVNSFRPHPQNPHLSLCLVHDGKRDLAIVCGAPNLRQGMKVALASEGAILPSGEKIGKTHLQGFLSEGMLCSEKELGLSEDAAGIMNLDSHLALGLPLEEALPLHDWIFDITVTPNRPDCLSILGIAREVAALTGKPLRHPEIDLQNSETGLEKKTSVIIERPDLCPRYVAKLIQGVQIAPSPFWMRRHLLAAGVRSINNVVDITNYIMLEMGQPLHAFDFNRLEEKRIVVRTVPPGLSFTTLDGVNRSLPEEALMICDGRNPVALAGIMGGQNSEVQSETTTILLESAYFDPMGIRRTSKRMGLSTEASVRFERGIDPNGCLKAAERAISMMGKWGGGAVIPGAIDNYPQKIEAKKIFLRVPRVNQILGTTLQSSEIENYLEKLGLEVRPGDAHSVQVIPPTFRVDLEREIDLVEEIARLYGFQRIPVTIPCGRVSAGQKTRILLARERARNLLTAFGFYEVINYSFISEKMLADLKLSAMDPRAKALRIHNPLSEDQSFMRTTLVPGLLETARSNFYRQNLNLKIFELDRIFLPREGQELPEEIENLAGLLSGMRDDESWARPKEETDFFDLKGVLEGILEGLGLRVVHFLPERTIPFLHPGKACRLEADDRVLGILGEVHPDVAKIFEFKQKVFLFELNFSLLAEMVRPRRKIQPLNRFPAVIRDLALIVDGKISAGDVLQTLWQENNGLVVEIIIFDLYQGNQVPAGKKSLAFHLKYQGVDRTLTDEEVNEIQEKVFQRIKQKYGAVLR